MPYGNNHTAGEDEPLHEDPVKNLRIENELLHLKIRAQFGGTTRNLRQLSPELENLFLKKVIDFEQKVNAARVVTIGELIGNPVLKKPWELTDAGIMAELKRLKDLLRNKQIRVVFVRDRDARVQYKFIMDELLKIKTEDMLYPGMSKCFIYEDFHPDHELTIQERTLRILSAWLGRNVAAIGTVMANQFVRPDSMVLSREQQLKRMEDWMSAYTRFEEGSFSIEKVSHVLKNDDPRVTAMGHAEGRIRYLAITPEGWKKVIEGPYKIYYSCERGWWGCFFFYMPGFNT